MDKGKKRKFVMIRLSEEEFNEISSVAGHYRKSEYIRRAVKAQIEADKARMQTKP